MHEETRVRVAAVVGSAAAHKSVGAVYDYSARKFKTATCSVENGVQGYDYGTRSHFSGNRGSLDFYDFQNRKHVQLKLEGQNFSGYDYATRKYFSGTVNGSSISLYDYETRKYYNYSV